MAERQVIEIPVAVLMATLTDNVHIAAYLACQQLGHAIAGEVWLNDELGCSIEPDYVELDDELDSVFQLSKPKDGRRFLVFAAAVIRMVGPKRGELVVRSLFRQAKESMDDLPLPARGMVKHFLCVIQKKLKMEPKNSGSEKRKETVRCTLRRQRRLHFTSDSRVKR